MPYHLLLDTAGEAQARAGCRSAPPAAASAPATPTRPRGWASACRTCSTRRSSRRRSPPRSSPSACALRPYAKDPALDLQRDDRGVPHLRPPPRAVHRRHGALSCGIARRGRARALRGRAGRAAGHRPRHVSVRHLVEPGRGRRLHRRRRRARRTSTRSGASPRPTPRASAPARSRPSCDDEIGEEIRQRGGEFGTTTGRARRTGWLDLVALRYAARINRLTALVDHQARRALGLRPRPRLHVLPRRRGRDVRGLPVPPVGPAGTGGKLMFSTMPSTGTLTFSNI